VTSLGLWVAIIEGAKIWLSVMNNLRNRGVEEFRSLVDASGLFQIAINAAFP